MIEAEEYVRQVLDALPEEMTDRGDIAMELRSHIMERMAAGETLHDILTELGDPAALAETYLAEVPLEAGAFGSRVAAKIIDLFLLVPLVVVGWFVMLPLMFAWFASDEWLGGLFVPMAIGLALGGIFLLLPALAERYWGRTPGKKLLGLRVVRENGARISFGQALVRQLPWVLQIFWIDALFPLFTERKQRAFEMLSKTRVIVNEA